MPTAYSTMDQNYSLLPTEAQTRAPGLEELGRLLQAHQTGQLDDCQSQASQELKFRLIRLITNSSEGNSSAVPTRAIDGLGCLNECRRSSLVNFFLDMLIKDELRSSSLTMAPLLKLLGIIIRDIMIAIRDEDADARHTLISRAPEFARHFKEIRHRLGLRDNAPDSIASNFNEMLTAYATLCSQPPGRIGTLNPAFPELCLYSWTVAPIRGDRVCGLLSIVTTYFDDIPRSVRISFMRDVVQHDTGLEAFVAAVTRELRDRLPTPMLDYKSQSSLMDCLEVFYALDLRPEIDVYLVKYDVPRLLYRTFQLTVQWPSLMDDWQPGLITWFCVIKVFEYRFDRFMTVMRDTGGGPSDDPAAALRGEDVVRTLARGIDLAASGEKCWNDGHERILRHNIQGVAKLSQMLKSLSSTTLHRFLKQLRAGLKVEWMPTLTRLQAAPCPEGVLDHGLRAATVQQWAGLGPVLWLDVEKERHRHARDMRGCCAWPECEKHESAGAAKLLSCKGCGEVRYCSRDCQKSDWGKGGHKTRCGSRIKD